MRELSREELFYIEQIAALSTDGASDAEIGEALEILPQRVLHLAHRFGVKFSAREARRRLGGLTVPKRWFSAPNPR